jgi:hypothetical protein
MARITRKDLQSIIHRLNLATGSPVEPYVKGDDGRFHAQPGCWHLNIAYGGFALHRMVNAGGGVSDPFGRHMPARDLYNRIYAMLTYSLEIKGAA